MYGNRRNDGLLPEGWAIATLEELLEPKGLFDGPFGSSLKTEDYTDSGVRVIRLENIGHLEFFEEKKTYVSENKYHSLVKHTVSEGDIIFGSFISDEVRACVLPALPTKAIAKADCFCIRPLAHVVVREFLTCQLVSQQMHDTLIEHVHGATRPRVNTRQLRKLTIAIAPLAEQKRVVTMVEALLERVRKARERLDRVQDIVNNFRQSVLAAACSGRLTVDWREENGISDDWTVAALDTFGTVSGGITKNSTRKSLPLQVPYLRVANVYANRLELDDVQTIGVKESELARTLLESGDVLFVEGNGSIEQIGRVAVWDGSIDGCVHQNHLIKFRANREILPHFILYYMMSQPGRERLMEQAVSTAGLHSLSISKIANIEVEVPSLKEQGEIIRRIDNLLDVTNCIEQRLAAAIRATERITQSTLAKAFAGELVETEAGLARREGRDYEPASVLLERIAAERAAAENGKPKRGKRKMKK